MTYSEKAKQWEKQELNRYLDSLDQEEDQDDGVYNDDYDLRDEEWERRGR